MKTLPRKRMSKFADCLQNRKKMKITPPNCDTPLPMWEMSDANREPLSQLYDLLPVSHHALCQKWPSLVCFALWHGWGLREKGTKNMSAEKEESEEQRVHLDVLHITTITPKIDGFSLHVGYAICFTLSLSLEKLQDNLLCSWKWSFTLFSDRKKERKILEKRD